MNYLRNNDNLSEGSEVKDVFGINVAVNVDTNEGIEDNVLNEDNHPALLGIPIPRNGGIHLCQPWAGG